jgi:hypothetical protein
MATRLNARHLFDGQNGYIRGVVFLTLFINMFLREARAKLCVGREGISL